MPQLLTRDEVATMLRVKPDAIRRWERLGVLPFVEVGEHTRRFLPSDVQSFIAAGRRNVTPEVAVA